MISRIIGDSILILVIFILSYLYFWKIRNFTKGVAFLLGCLEAGCALRITIAFNQSSEVVPANIGGDPGEIMVGYGLLMLLMLALGRKNYVEIKKRIEAEYKYEERLYQTETMNKAKRYCPYCGETILAIAIKCRYCEHDLTASEQESLPSLMESTQEETPVVNFLYDLLNVVLGVNNRPIDEEFEIEEKIYQAEVAGKAKKSCPYCGEEILATAIKCRYCGSTLSEAEPEPCSASASDLAGLDQRIDQTEFQVNMENYGVAPNPKPIPDGIVDFRSTVWITSMLIILGCVALGISYLSK